LGRKGRRVGWKEESVQNSPAKSEEKYKLNEAHPSNLQKSKQLCQKQVLPRDRRLCSQQVGVGFGQESRVSRNIQYEDAQMSHKAKPKHNYIPRRRMRNCPFCLLYPLSNDGLC